VFDPSQVDARNPSIQMYFYAFLDRRTLTRRQNGLVALRANGWEPVAQKGSHIPLSTPWKLGPSTGVVANREERQARHAEGKAKVQALWRGNLGRRLTGDTPLKMIELAKRVSNFRSPGPDGQDRIRKSLGGFPRQIVAAVHDAMLVASREHRRVVRRAAGLERIPQAIQCYRGDADLGPLGEAHF
jgi:hypothetical protein